MEDARMEEFDFYDYRKRKFRNNKMVQDALIALLPPLLLLVGILIASFLAHHPQ
jgi:hypothetical protein